MATILGVYAITTSATSTTSSTLTTSVAMPYLMGHVTLVVTDSDGNIKSYIQSDNLVTTEGLNCAIDVLLGPAGGCNSGGGFINISLSDNSTSAAETDLATDYVLREIARATTADTHTQTGSIVTLIETFIEGDDSGLAIGEIVRKTALHDSNNDLNDNDMLAVVSLEGETTIVAGDSITVTWTVTGS